MLNSSLSRTACFSSADHKKIRSKPELVRAVGPNYDLSMFDFRTGKMLQSSIRKSKRLKGTTYDYARGLCAFVLMGC